MWFKVDDGFYDHPKADVAGTAALGLWVRCGSYCGKHLTEGFVPEPVAARFGTPQMVKSLVTAGLWLQVDGGYQFHEWSQMQPSKESVLAAREAAAKRRSAGRAKSASSDRRPTVGRPSDDGVMTVGGSSSSPTRPDLEDFVFNARGDDDGSPQAGDNPVVADLVEQLRVESMPVRSDRMTVEQVAAVARLVGVHGIPRLVAVARRVWRQDRPAVHLQALIGDWEAMRPPGVASIGKSVCEEHGTEFRTVCAGCAADRKAAGA